MMLLINRIRNEPVCIQFLRKKNGIRVSFNDYIIALEDLILFHMFSIIKRGEIDYFLVKNF
jgi:hypothetical protein